MTSVPKTLPYLLLQATYQRYDRSGRETGGGSFGPGYGESASLEPQGALTVVGGTMESWVSTAVARAMGSGSVAEGFDNVQYLVDDSTLEVPHARNATWIRGVVVRQVSVKLAVTCPDGIVLSETLTAFDGNHPREYTLNCDAPGGKAPATESLVREACAQTRG